MIKIYHYSTCRSKFSEKGKTASSLKKELYKKDCRCYLCSKEFNLGQLQLEHRIPVEVGGHLFNENNIDLVCSRCHSKKTIIDKRVIHIMKSMKIIFSKGQSFFNLTELKNTYLQFYDIIKHSDYCYNVWFTGQPNIDYEQIFLEENRK